MNRKQILFGNRLKELRLRKNMTQEQLGTQLGITANAVGQFERGIMYPNFETLYRIINVLDVDANLIFSKDTVEYPTQSKWFAALLSDMSDEEKLVVSKFLENLSRILIQPQTEMSLIDSEVDIN